MSIGWSQNIWANSDKGTFPESCDLEVEDSETSIIFNSTLDIGYIGIDAEHEVDHRSDNVFTIDINQIFTENQEVWLEFELEGVQSAASIALSINDRSSVGGYLIHKSDGWHAQKEFMRADWLVTGKNYIQFGHRSADGFRYGVRDVRVVVKPEKKEIKNNIIWNEISTTEEREDGLLRSYLRGVVLDPTEDLTVFKIGNQEVEIIDGGFEYIIESKVGEINHWTENVVIDYSDGITYKEVVDLMAGSTSGNWKTTTLDYVNRTAGHVFINRPNKIGWTDRASIQIDSGIVKRDMTIHLSTLRGSDLVLLDQNLTNVTGQMSGVRCLPHGGHFTESGALLTLPYDKKAIPAGYTEKDIFTFYYDRELNKWSAVQRDSIDHEKGVIYSRITHFTDFINGIISAPETPTSSAFVPTQFQDIAVANPMAGVQLMSPPSASQHGDANLSYPIIVPPGRRGMQPSLAVSYNSGGGSGLLGEGWDLNVPCITIETRWGVPRYDDDMESEAYLLNGKQLILLDPNKGEYLPHRRNKSDWATRRDNAEFKVRSQGSGNFEKIIRKGTDPTNYTWEVTDRSGVKYFYGSLPMATGHHLETTVGEDSKWHLRRVEDLYGNYMTYSYAPFQDLDLGGGVMATNLYLTEISYTGHTNNAANAKVVLEYEPKIDPTINTRTGTIVRNDKRLKRVDVQFNTSGFQTIREYIYTYRDNDLMPFRKTLLDRIDQKVGGETLSSHVMDYFDDVDNGSYEEDPTWNLQNQDVPPLEVTYSLPGITLGVADVGFSPISGSRGKGYGLSLYLGVGSSANLGSYKVNSIGASFSFARSESEGAVSLVDMDGDGLLDKVFKNAAGQIEYRKNKVRNLDGTLDLMEPFEMGNARQLGYMGHVDFSKKIDKSFSFGVQGHTQGLMAGIGTRISTSKMSSYFSDVNGDGFIDIINDKVVNFGVVDEDGNVSLSKTPGGLDCPLISPTIDASAYDISDVERDELLDMHPRLDVVRVWEAPYMGIVNVDLGAIVCTNSSEDGAVILVQHSKGSDNTNNVEVLNKTIMSGQTLPLTPAEQMHQISVDPGDRLYFRVGAGLSMTTRADPLDGDIYTSSGVSDEVSWDPSITYASGQALDDPYGQNYDVYQYSNDFLFSQMKGFAVTENTTGIQLAGNVKTNAPLSDAARVVIVDDLDNLIRSFDIPNDMTSVDIGHTWDEMEIDPSSRPVAYYKIEVHSNSNIDWKQIEFSNLVLTLPDQDFSGGEVPIEYKFYRKLPVRDFQTVALPTGPILSSSGVPAILSNIDNLIDLEPGSSFFLNIKDNQTTYFQQEFVFNGIIINAMPPNVTGTIPPSGDLYCTITSEHSITFPSNAILGNISVVINGISRVVSAYSIWNYDQGNRVQFNNLYRNWGHFAYNPDGDYSSNVDDPIADPNIEIDQTLLEYDPDSFEYDDPMDPTNPTEEEETVRLREFVFWPVMCTWNVDLAQFTWTPGDENTYITESVFRPSRLAEDNPISNPLAGFSGTEYPGISKEYKSTSTSVTGGGGTPVGDASFTIHSSGSMKSKLDFMDLNGDRIPDIITEDNITYTYADGDHETPKMNTAGTYRSTNSASGFSIGGKAKFAKSNEDPEAAIEYAKTSGYVGINAGDNQDTGEDLWVDVNGDGLMDKVGQDGIQLNLGYSFVSINNGQARVESSLSNSVGIGANVSINNGSFNFGIGYSSTNADNSSSYIDINGDGLTDYVDYNSPTDQVYINTGMALVPYSQFALPGGEANKTKMLGYTSNAAFSVEIPIWAVKLVINPGANTSVGMNRTEAAFKDVDGDGFVDYIQQGSDDVGQNAGFSGDANLTVHRSKIARTNKLRSVSNSLGGSFEIDYGLSAATIQHPGGKWVMNDLVIKESMNDTYAPPIHTEFAYRKGKYERCERQFLGFGEVQVNEFIDDNNGGEAVYRKNLTEYHNDNVYRSGRMVTNKVLDASDSEWIKNSVTHESKDIDAIVGGTVIDYSTGAPEEQVIFTAPVRSQTNLSYNGGGDRLGESSLMKYDIYGNVKDVYYSNSGSLVNDMSYDNHANVVYDIRPVIINNNILGAPITHTVDEAGNILRESSAVVNDQGSVTKQTVKVSGCDGNADAVTDYMYNGFGNVKQMTAPDNGNGQRNTYKYLFDNLEIYTTKVTDDLNFVTDMTYMPEFGVMTSTTSIHGHTISTPHDSQGRLKGMSYSGPNDPDIHFYYDLVNKMARTTRAVPGSEGGLMESYVFMDGLGRALGQGTEANVEGTNTVVWSGVPTYDDLGRVTAASKPLANASITQPAIGGDLSFTIYDLLDRPLTSETLDQEYSYDYGYGTDELGINRLLTTVTDPIAHETKSYSDYNGGVWQTTRVGVNGDANIITQFKLDGIDQVREVKAPNNIVTTYGIGPDGRMTSKSNIDIGTHSYCYSPLGLKTKHTEGNWEANYLYDYHRLTNINYAGDFAKYNVEYKYGDQIGGAPENRDRVTTIKDISGYQQFEYNELGAVKKHTRDYALPLITNKSRFVTMWTYDAWNRVQTITYPDTEIVTYSYDEGGNLYAVAGSKSNTPYLYINSITYDEYGQRKKVVSGNDVMQTYIYNDDTRFLERMESPGINNCDYGFDLKGNVTSKTNSGSPLGSGGATYVYDSFDRIKNSDGNWSGDGGVYSYDNTYKYDGAGNFLKKNSLITRTDPLNYPLGLSKNSKKTYHYVTSGIERTNQIKYIAEDYQERIGADKGLNRLTNHEYRVDNHDLTLPGLLGENVTGIYRDAEEKNFDNQVESPISNPSLSRTRMVYQTENRLGAINIDNNLNHYFYDGVGERFLKMKETLQDIYVNGEPSGNELLPVDYTFYASPLLVIRPGSYTKHIYVGSDRIVSKIGENEDYKDPTDYSPPGNIANHLDAKKTVMETIIADNYGLLMDIGIDDFTRIPIDPATVFGFSKSGGGAENDRYFFSKDQIGSSHFMTDAGGAIISHAEYMPFGETYVDWSSIDWKTPYRFTGQEQDCETGLYYYGARYYDPGVGRFLTTDPLMDMYPGWSPYNYTLNNPVRYTDPTGMSVEGGDQVDNGFIRDTETGEIHQISYEGGDDYDVLYSGSRNAEGIWEIDDTDPEYSNVEITEFGIGYYSEASYGSRVYSRSPASGQVNAVDDPFTSGEVLAVAAIAKFFKASMGFFARRLGAKTTKGLWSLTKEGASKIKRHSEFGKLYKSKSDGLWWAVDNAGHGGSKFKVFTESKKGLEWFRDADQFGDFILNKHKGATGKFIPWGQLKTIK